MSYSGQTQHRLSQCLDDHWKAVTSADLNASALAEHAWTHHPIVWCKVAVLSSAQDLHTHFALESVHIRTQADTSTSLESALILLYN